jgi:hypothetical protein
MGLCIRGFAGFGIQIIHELNPLAVRKSNFMYHVLDVPSSIPRYVIYYSENVKYFALIETEGHDEDCLLVCDILWPWGIVFNI